MTTKRFIYRVETIGGAKVTSVDFADDESLVQVLRDGQTYYLHTTSRLLALKFEDRAIKVIMNVPLQSDETLVRFIDIPSPAVFVSFVTNKRIMFFNSGEDQSNGYAEVALYPGETLEAMVGEVLACPFITNRRILNMKSLLPAKWVSYEPGPGASATLRKNKKGLFSFLTSPYSLLINVSGEKLDLAISEERLPIAEQVVKLFS